MPKFWLLHFTFWIWASGEHSEAWAIGRGAFLIRWKQIVRFVGGWGSENVGMSNHNSAEYAEHRKPKVSLAMAINQGLGDPKANPKGAVKGQPVNIPALRWNFFSKRRKLVVSVDYRISIRVLRFSNGMREVLISVGATEMSSFPRKSLRELNFYGIVPQNWHR